MKPMTIMSYTTHTNRYGRGEWETPSHNNGEIPDQKPRDDNDAGNGRNRKKWLVIEKGASSSQKGNPRKHCNQHSSVGNMKFYEVEHNGSIYAVRSVVTVVIRATQKMIIFYSYRRTTAATTPSSYRCSCETGWCLTDCEDDPFPFPGLTRRLGLDFDCGATMTAKFSPNRHLVGAEKRVGCSG